MGVGGVGARTAHAEHGDDSLSLAADPDHVPLIKTAAPRVLLQARSRDDEGVHALEDEVLA